MGADNHLTVDMSDEIIRQGDVFKTRDGPIKVVASGPVLTVTDPTVSHPQDARSGEWEIHRDTLRRDIRDGRVKRGTLTVK